MRVPPTLPSRYVLRRDGEVVQDCRWPGNLECRLPALASTPFVPVIQLRAGHWRGEHAGVVYTIDWLDPDWIPCGDRVLAECVDGPCVGEQYDVSTQLHPCTECEDCGPDGYQYQAVQGESGEWWLRWLERVPTVAVRLATPHYYRPWERAQST